MQAHALGILPGALGAVLAKRLRPGVRGSAVHAERAASCAQLRVKIAVASKALVLFHSREAMNANALQ
jgi:hypothetical protein